MKEKLRLAVAIDKRLSFRKHISRSRQKAGKLIEVVSRRSTLGVQVAKKRRVISIAGLPMILYGAEI
mgnify:FL=1